MKQEICLSEQDQDFLKSCGLQKSDIEHQVQLLQASPPSIKIIAPCTVGHGITVLTEDEQSRLEYFFNREQFRNNIIKFVPASGAATRMFKFLFSYYHDPKKENINSTIDSMDEAPDIKKFFANIKKFPFYKPWKQSVEQAGESFEALLQARQYLRLLYYLLDKSQLNLPNRLPKGLMPFHVYPNEIRTAFEEHLVESVEVFDAALSAHDIHFSVSPKQLSNFQKRWEDLHRKYSFIGRRWNISFSTQSIETSVVALDSYGNLFRDPSGRLSLRPGGHGALINNLGQLDAAVVFIKNIDNVMVDTYHADSIRYQKILGGLFLELQNEIFDWLRKLEIGPVSELAFSRLIEFCREQLNLCLPKQIENMHANKQRSVLFKLLNRPFRVCGMVKNIGEPGGGPFWVENEMGIPTCQIVESAQIDRSSPEQLDAFEKSTHFNPVDLVCGLWDFNCQPFSLQKFADPETYFLVNKSHEGQNIKSLEWPGLWNGAMAAWNTVFVEVPISTFAPVKTVFDFLRPEHQYA